MEDGDIAHLNEFLLLPEGYLHLWAPSPPQFEHPRPPFQNPPLQRRIVKVCRKHRRQIQAFCPFFIFPNAPFNIFFFVKLNGSWRGKPNRGDTPARPPQPPLLFLRSLVERLTQ